MKKTTSSLLLKRQLRSLGHNWTQFLAIILIGAIAVTLFVGLFANADIFEAQIEEAYSEGNLASLWVTTETYDEEDKTNIDNLVGTDGETEGRLYLPGKLGSHSVYLAVYDKSPTISKPYGEMETSEKNTDTYFAYLDTELKSYLGTDYALGDTLSVSFDISSYNADLLAPIFQDYVKDGGTNLLEKEDVSLSAEITGFMHYPENVLKATYNTSVIVLSYQVMKESVLNLLNENYTEEGVNQLIDAGKTFLGIDLSSDTLETPNQYLIHLNDESKAEELKEKIKAYYNSKEDNYLYLVTERSDMPFYKTLDSDAKQARQFTFVFPFVFFLTALLVILTTLSQLVLKDRAQIGTLKALGVSRKKIYGMYIVLSLIVVGIGTLIGEILGPLIIPNILGKKYLIIYSLPSPHYQFPVLAGILTAVVFLGSASLVTFLLCRKEVRLKPSESLRPQPPRFKAKVKRRKNNRLSLAIAMAFRNIRLSKAKSTMVILGVLGCTALLACGYGIEDTVNYGIDHDMTLFMNSDIMVQTSSSESEEEIRTDLTVVEGVESIEPYITRNVSLVTEDNQSAEDEIYVFSKFGEHVTFSLGDKDGAAMGVKLADKLGVKEGDKISFTFDGEKVEVTVTKIFEAFIMNHLILSTENSIFSDRNLTYNNAFVDVYEGADSAEVSSSLKELKNISDSKTKRDYLDLINGVMSGVFVMTNAVKTFAILLAVVVVYNLSLMNFKERTRDIATLKVLGFSKAEIGASLLFETMTLTFVGVLFGLLLGYPFLRLVMGTNIVDLVYYLYHINAISYLYSFLLTFVVAFAVNLLFVFRIRKIKMVESLKSVE